MKCSLHNNTNHKSVILITRCSRHTIHIHCNNYTTIYSIHTVQKKVLANI